MATDSMIRAFIAIDLPEDVSEQIGNILLELKRDLGERIVRWVPKQNIHLTLKFLGNVSTTNLVVLENVLSSVVAQHHFFTVQVGGLGAYPKVRSPRVIWIGVETTPELIALQGAVDKETDRMGYPSERRPYSAHLTLGRVSRNATLQDVERISNFLMEHKNVGVLGSILVRAVHLYRSDLRPDGAVYTRLFTAGLKP